MGSGHAGERNGRQVREHVAGRDLSHSLRLLWGTGEARRRGPDPGLTLQQIVVAAVRLADHEGLPALSMRRVAAELGVGTMSLYRYVPNKATLLDLMFDHVNGLPPDAPLHGPARGWRSRLETIAWGIWDLYHRHPWLLQANQARPVLGPRSLEGFEGMVAALGELGLTSREKVAVSIGLENLVTGAARTDLLQRQAAVESGMSDEEFWGAQEPFLERAMATGRYPAMARLSEDAFTLDNRQMLEIALRALLDGFERHFSPGMREPQSESQSQSQSEDDAGPADTAPGGCRD